MTLGLVCDFCDMLSGLNATLCAGCGEPLGIIQRGVDSSQAVGSEARPGETPLFGMRPIAAEEGGGTAALDGGGRAPARRPAVGIGGRGAGSGGAQPADAPSASARSCPSCGAPLQPSQKFCGECGARVDAPAAVPVRTQYYGAMQTAGRARLILIKGEGLDGVSYQLAGTEHLAGRSDGAILFPDDPLLSPRHANFFYRDGRLHVRDEGSHNGVFIRVKTPVAVEHGATFLVGEQLLRVEATAPEGAPIPDATGTYFYGSPKRPARVSIVQLLAGGDIGLVFRARSESISIGREGNDVSFPSDPFISSRHASVTAVEGGRFQIADLGSRNGTFVRVRGEAALAHGDYLFLGQQLLRVEIT